MMFCLKPRQPVLDRCPRYPIIVISVDGEGCRIVAVAHHFLSSYWDEKDTEEMDG